MARFLLPDTAGVYRLNFDALDGNMMGLSFVDPVPYPLRNHDPRSGYGGGAPVSPVNMPTKLRLGGQKSQLKDINTAYHILLVNQTFLDVIEVFQKDIQWFPVECLWDDGTPAPPYFFFFTPVMLDAVARDRTTATWTPTLPGQGLWQPKLSKGETFVFEKSRFGNAHIWIDPNMPTIAPLVSEALYQALVQAKIEAFQTVPQFEEI